MDSFFGSVSGEPARCRMEQAENEPAIFEQRFVADMFRRSIVDHILKDARIIREDTGYGQVNIIITPDGIAGVTHQVWWNPDKAS